MPRLFRKSHKDKMRDSLSAYIDGSLTPEGKAGLEKHLEQCEECRQEVASLEATVLLLRRVPQVTPRRSFVLTGEPAKRPAFSLRPLGAMRFATAVAALLLVAVFLSDFLEVLPKEAVAPTPTVGETQRFDELAGPPGPTVTPIPRLAVVPTPSPAPKGLAVAPFHEEVATPQPEEAIPPSRETPAAGAADLGYKGRPTVPWRGIEIGFVALVLVLLASTGYLTWRARKAG